MLTCSIVYASLHTNARRLSESMVGALDRGQCIYVGLPHDNALYADVLFWGGNTDTLTPEIQAFLEKAKQKNKIIVPYGHLCKGGAKDLYAIGAYARTVMHNVAVRLEEMKREQQIT